MSGNDDTTTNRRDYRNAYSVKHHIPTVQEYRSQKKNQQADIGHDAGQTEQGGVRQTVDDKQSSSSREAQVPSSRPDDGQPAQDNVASHGKDTSQTTATQDPVQRRKAMKKRGNNRVEREVTDPVTHLPVTIRDYTDADLEKQDHEESAEDAKTRQSSSLSQRDSKEEHDQHAHLETLFPPPQLDALKDDLASTYSTGLLIAISAMILGVGVNTMLCYGLQYYLRKWKYANALAMSVAAVPILPGIVLLRRGVDGWMKRKIREACEDSAWETQRQLMKDKQDVDQPEYTPTLNSLLASVWPLINPDMFRSIADTLEDVLQASLPKMVRMISVDDIGQGSEPIRILGVRVLPKGHAAQSVTTDGKTESKNEETQQKQTSLGESDEEKEAQEDASKDTNDRDTSADDAKSNDEAQDSGVSAGMEAEEGEFVNLELAFAYRAANINRKLHRRSKNAHLYMAFYMPGNVKFPVWVELRGLVGSLRARLQLTPDPPFVALCTLTFLGQPRVDLSCTPLVKKGLNIMDLPLISNFVQSAVDAAMSEYVAPKSLTLDLKAMLAGDDFKKDTSARGVLIVRIKRAFDFKAGDISMPLTGSGSSDSYVSVGWAKFGKPVWSTRVIVDDMKPHWEEETSVLVSPEELDADENLRVQLWDSDKATADDDLGRIELKLKDLMENESSNGKMWDRTDSFKTLEAGEQMPGRLEWSVGYFTKTRLMDYQVAQHTGDSEVKTVKQFKEQSFEQSKKKLREAAHDESAEIQQLKTQDFETASIDMITSSPPSEEYPSGILSIQIHQIVGLEIEKQNKNRDVDANEVEQVDESSANLPDSYCTVALNDQTIFKTRTKPKNSKPFFNACTERFIRDWRTATTIISVRDARVHEDNPLLGMVYLRLGDVLRARHASRFNDYYPLAGGIGYGRIRISVVFRSVQLQAPRASLGWDYGTLEIAPEVRCSDGLPSDLQGMTLRLRTPLARGKMRSAGSGTWAAKGGHPLRLPVRSRYATALVAEFRHKTLLSGKAAAWAVLWLRGVPDDDDDDDAAEIALSVMKGNLARAEANVLSDEEAGQRIGTLNIKMRFWRGLGRFHDGLARKNRDVADVMEVLECAVDNGEMDSLVGDRAWLEAHDKGSERRGEDGKAEQSSSGSSSSSGGGGSSDDENSGGGAASTSLGGLLGDLKGDSAQKEQLHRRHRGAMQWKGPRTLKWMKHKAENAADHIEDKFKHQERQPDVETES